RVPFERRDERPENPREVYPPVIDIAHFRHFLNLFEIHDPMDNPNDEPMWAADRVVALTPGLIRNCHGTVLTKGNNIKNFYHGLNETTQEALNAAIGGIFLYKMPNQAYQLLEDKVLLKLDWAKNQKPKNLVSKTIAFADEGSSNSDINKIMARMDAMTMKRMLNNYDNESSDDDNDDDDVKKDEEDEEDEEEEEHLASADPSVVPTDNPVPSS
ncbi:hypothetical protein Tco_1246708, partial [Tanacetum coccineum]